MVRRFLSATILILWLCTNALAVEPAPASSSATEKKTDDEGYKRVYQSLDEIPAWVEHPVADDEKWIYGVGKGNNLKGVFEAQYLAVQEAVGLLMDKHLGKDTKREINIDWLRQGRKMTMIILVRIPLQKGALEIEDVHLVGSYTETWEQAGQRVFVAWAKVSWSRRTLKRALQELSI